MDAAEDWTISVVSGIFVTVNDRERFLRNIPRVPRADLNTIPDNWNPPVRVNGGNNSRGIIPERTVIGPSGCGPCVGVIFVPPNRNLPVYVFHFTSNDNSISSLILTMSGRRIPNAQGYEAVLCGAETQANRGAAYEAGRTLDYALQAIRFFAVPIRGYVPAPSVFVDRDGRLYSDPAWTGGGFNLDGFR
jgi:hypothetical protein